MMQEIFEFSQLLPAVVDLTKVFKFCQEFCQLKEKFLLECYVFLPAPNTDYLVELTNNYYTYIYIYIYMCMPQIDRNKPRCT